MDEPNNTVEDTDAAATRTLTSDKVFAIPELIEMTLLKLPIKDILLNANRVCRHWNTTIKNSPKLQQALFFSPLQSKVADTLREAYDKRYVEKRGRAHAPYVVENPFYVVLMNRGGPWRKTSRLRLDVYHRREASWRRMLVCQPPINLTTASVRTKDNSWTIKAENSTGVRFQDVEASAMEKFRGLPKFVGVPAAYISGECFAHLPEVASSEQWLSVEIAEEVKRIAEGDTTGVVSGIFPHYE